MIMENKHYRLAFIGTGALVTLLLAYLMMPSDKSRYEQIHDVIEDNYYLSDHLTNAFNKETIDAISAHINEIDIPILVQLAGDPDTKIAHVALYALAEFKEKAIAPLFEAYEIVLKREDHVLIDGFKTALIQAAEQKIPQLSIRVKQELLTAENHLVSTYGSCHALPTGEPEMIFPIESMAQAQLMTGLPIPLSAEAIQEVMAMLKEEMLPAQLKVFPDETSSGLDAFFGNAPKKLVIVSLAEEQKCNAIVKDTNYRKLMDMLSFLSMQLEDNDYVRYYCENNKTVTLHRTIANEFERISCVKSVEPEETEEKEEND